MIRRTEFQRKYAKGTRWWYQNDSAPDRNGWVVVTNNNSNFDDRVQVSYEDPSGPKGLRSNFWVKVCKLEEEQPMGDFDCCERTPLLSFTETVEVKSTMEVVIVFSAAEERQLRALAKNWPDAYHGSGHEMHFRQADRRNVYLKAVTALLPRPTDGCIDDAAYERGLMRLLDDLKKGTRR